MALPAWILIAGGFVVVLLFILQPLNYRLRSRARAEGRTADFWSLKHPLVLFTAVALGAALAFAYVEVSGQF